MHIMTIEKCSGAPLTQALFILISIGGKKSKPVPEMFDVDSNSKFQYLSLNNGDDCSLHKMAAHIVDLKT